MDLKLKRLLEQAQFTKYKGRGYDAAEVDDFLDRATAMAAKVEVQLTEALGRSGSSAAPAEPAAPAGPSKEEIEAEIERRVAAHVAELPPPPEPAAPVIDEAASVQAAEEAAEEARRTLVLAQRTADAAIREAREEADRLLSDARDQAGSSVTDAESHAQQVRSDAEADASRERNEARERLAGEIRELEQAREALRSDVHSLEHHVEAQRSKVGSAIGELQRVFDDPDGIRLAPAPETNAEVPDLTPEPVPAVEAPSAATESSAEPVADVAIEASDDTAEDRSDEPVEESETASDASEPSPSGAAVTDDGAVADAEIDHEAPDTDAPVVDLGTSGPPTRPVDAVDLDLDAAAAEGDGTFSDSSSGDDAFLAELRKAMADDEPLGPRDTAASAPADLFGEDRPRRFGRRR